MIKYFLFGFIMLFNSVLKSQGMSMNSELNSIDFPSIFESSLKENKPKSPFKTSVGLGIETGGGGSIVGPSYKHYFTPSTAYNVELLFGTGVVTTNVFYQYHKEVKKGDKMKWYNGAGLSTGFTAAGVVPFIKLMTGLETQLPDLPMFVTVDWRPSIFLGNTVGGRFVPGRFGLSVRYVLAE